MLAKLCFETFFRHCKNSLDKINIHLVFRPKVEKEIIDYINKVFEKNNTKYVSYQVEEPTQKSKEKLSLLIEDSKIEKHLHDQGNTQWNVDSTMQFMMENCGKEQWVFIGHNDIWFDSDPFDDNSEYAKYLNNYYGQIGKHEYGLVAHSRKAYKTSNIKFMNLSGLALWKRPWDNKFCIIHNLDERYTNDLIQIHEFDNEELYILEIQQNGYKYKYFPVEIAQRYINNVGGNCLTIYPDSQRIITKSLIDRLKCFGIE